MAATAIYSETMVLWKETAFSLCRATEKRWKRNVVSRVSSANLLCELNGHLMPCTSCLYGKWVVCTGQLGVFVYLVLCCLVGCCTWFICRVANGTQQMCLVLLRPRPLAFLWPMAREWCYLGVCCHPASGSLAL